MQSPFHPSQTNNLRNQTSCIPRESLVFNQPPARGCAPTLGAPVPPGALGVCRQDQPSLVLQLLSHRELRLLRLGMWNGKMGLSCLPSQKCKNSRHLSFCYPNQCYLPLIALVNISNSDLKQQHLRIWDYTKPVFIQQPSP